MLVHVPFHQESNLQIVSLLLSRNFVFCDDIYFKFHSISYQNKDIDENLKHHLHALLNVLPTVGTFTGLHIHQDSPHVHVH